MKLAYFGCVMLTGGFMIGVTLGFFNIWDAYWIVSFSIILAGLIILSASLIRAIWRTFLKRS